MTRRAYPLNEVAEMLGVSQKTLRREIKDGRLAARRIRGVLVVVTAEVDRYLDAAPDEPSEAGQTVRIVKTSPASTRGRVQRLVTPIVRLA